MISESALLLMSATGIDYYLFIVVLIGGDLTFASASIRLMLLTCAELGVKAVILLKFAF